MKKDDNPTVYSTELGRICPDCGRPKDDCICRRQARPLVPGESQVRIWRETKGRKGKTVTLVKGVLLNDSSLRELLSELKRQCGGGGSIKDGVIEIQGDHREKVLSELKKRGFSAKLAGG